MNYTIISGPQLLLASFVRHVTLFLRIYFRFFFMLPSLFAEKDVFNTIPIHVRIHKIKDYGRKEYLYVCVYN